MVVSLVVVGPPTVAARRRPGLPETIDSGADPSPRPDARCHHQAWPARCSSSTTIPASAGWPACCCRAAGTTSWPRQARRPTPSTRRASSSLTWCCSTCCSRTATAPTSRTLLALLPHPPGVVLTSSYAGGGLGPRLETTPGARLRAEGRADRHPAGRAVRMSEPTDVRGRRLVDRPSLVLLGAIGALRRGRRLGPGDHGVPGADQRGRPRGPVRHRVGRRRRGRDVAAA